MNTLNASLNPIVVDREAGETDGDTSIKYVKESPYTELWERVPGSAWTQVNVHTRTGQGDIADRSGQYRVKLSPGERYDVGLYAYDQGPLSGTPKAVASMVVLCLWKRARERTLITGHEGMQGGTWHRHDVVTNVPTNIVAAGVSRLPARVDADDLMPELVDPDAVAAASLPLAASHSMQFAPLLAGNRYFYLILVTDVFGNWDWIQADFTTARRKVTVNFPTLRVYNDGDPMSYGEAEFWFRVALADSDAVSPMLGEFHLPTQDVDDWAEHGRPYAVGFSFVGQPETVTPASEVIYVQAWGKEHDGILESDEGASSESTNLPFPSGPNETVLNKMFTMDCPYSTTNDDFHFGVDVRWSVEYVA